MKKSFGEIMSDPRIWEMSEEEKQRGLQRVMEIAKREMESGMLTYKDDVDGLMWILSRSMRFDSKTLRRLFHAVTHHKQVWFDVVIEFRDGNVDEGGLIVKTPHQLRFLLNKIHHIRTRYEISDRED